MGINVLLRVGKGSIFPANSRGAEPLNVRTSPFGRPGPSARKTTALPGPNKYYDRFYKYYDRKNKYYDRNFYRSDRKNGDYTCKNGRSHVRASRFGTPVDPL